MCNVTKECYNNVVIVVCDDGKFFMKFILKIRVKGKMKEKLFFFRFAVL